MQSQLKSTGTVQVLLYSVVGLLAAPLTMAEIPLSSENWSYPDSLDAAVASPSQYKVLYDDIAVRLLEVTLLPGQKEGKHADHWPAVLIFDTAPGKIRRQSDNGKTLDIDSSKDKDLDGPLPVLVRVPPAAPHADENVGTTPEHYYRVEFKKLKFDLYDSPSGPYWSSSGQAVPKDHPIINKAVVDDATPQFADPDHWPFPFSMDSFIASPEAHTLRFQDAKVRFVEVLGHPFHREGMHDHRYPTVFLNDTPGPKVVDDHYDGTVVVSNPANNPLSNGPFPQFSAHSPDLPHAGMDIDDHDGHFYRLEFKTFRFQYYTTGKGRVRITPENTANASVLTGQHMPANIRRQ
jgi:hypothetical protein